MEPIIASAIIGAVAAVIASIAGALVIRGRRKRTLGKSTHLVDSGKEVRTTKSIRRTKPQSNRENLKILLIEDDPVILNNISIAFKIRWSKAIVLKATEGLEGIELAESESPDIVVLDINLPDMDGFAVLKQIRRSSNVPVMILTVRDAEIDEVRALEMGADDYIIKPFRVADLLARAQAVLRRGETQ